MDRDFELVKQNLSKLDSLELKDTKHDYSSKILKKFKSVVSDERFFDHFYHILRYLISVGNIATTKNILQISHKRKNHIYVLKIILLRNNAMIKILNKDGKCQKEIYGYVINSKIGKNLMFINKEIKNIQKTICDITENTTISHFDLIGLEDFKYSKITNHNFCLDKKINNRKNNISVYKNFIKEQWLYRVDDNYIISQNKKEYNYPFEVKRELNIEDELYALIGKSSTSNNIYLDKCKNFDQVDYNLVENYFEGKCSIDDILLNIKRKKHTK